MCSGLLGDGDRSLFYRRRHSRNPRLPREMGGRGGDGRREGGREGEKGEVRGSGLTGSRNMNGRLPLLQKQQLQAE